MLNLYVSLLIGSIVLISGIIGLRQGGSDDQSITYNIQELGLTTIKPKTIKPKTIIPLSFNKLSNNYYKTLIIKNGSMKLININTTNTQSKEIVATNIIINQEEKTIPLITNTDKLKIISDHKFEHQGSNPSLSASITNFPIVIEVSEPVFIPQLGHQLSSGSLLSINSIQFSPQMYHAKLSIAEQDIVIFNNPSNTEESITIGDLPSSGTLILSGHIRKEKANLDLINKDAEASFTYQRSGDQLVINYTNLTPGKQYQRELSPTQKSPKQTLTFTVSNPLRVISQKNITSRSVQNNNFNGYGYEPTNNTTNVNNYHICLNQPINETATTLALTQALGSGNFMVAYSQTTDEYDNKPGLNKCLMFYYYINPEQSFEKTINNITSQRGETIDVKISIPPHTIDPAHQFTTIIGNKINIIAQTPNAATGIQIGYQNNKTTILARRTCSLPGSSQLMENLTFDNSYNYTELFESLIVCGSRQFRKISFDNFERRRNKIVTVPFSTLFGNNTPEIFQVTLGKKPNKGTIKTFVRSQRGVLSKISSKEGHLRVYNFDNGQPANDLPATIIIRSNKDNKAFMSTQNINLTNGYGRFSVNHEINYNNNIIALALIGKNPQTLIPISEERFNISNDKNNIGSYKNSFSLNPYTIGGGVSRNMEEINMYAYTDRALYKAGDKIFVSGWIKKKNQQFGPIEGSVIVELTSPEGNSIETKTITQFDEFGGFITSFDLPSQTKLGLYVLSYNFIPNNGGSQASFLSYINVQEYQKRNFFVKIDSLQSGKQQIISFKPEYYFGGPLQSVDASIEYTFSEGNSIIDRSHCGQERCYEPILYNFRIGSQQSTFGSENLSNHQGGSFGISRDFAPQSIGNLNINMTLKDNSTNEILLVSKNVTLYPNYLIGLEGRTYQRAFSSQKTHTIKGHIKQKKSDNHLNRSENFKTDTSITGVSVIIYQKNNQPHIQQGIDNERYYEGQRYQQIKTIFVPVSNGQFSYDLDIQQGGIFFVRVLIPDQGIETQQVVYSRQSSYNYSMGDIPNNHILSVNIAPKNYQAGDIVSVNIEPQIKGARYILSLEKDGILIEQQQGIVDEKPITFTVKKERYPNIHVGVAQIVSEQTNSVISPNRAEPRMMIGYKSIDLSPEQMSIKTNITIKDRNGTTKSSYLPGEKIKLTIQTTNSDNQPVKTRLSVGIIDKALIDLYDQIKNPLAAMYKNTMPGFNLSNNFTVLYKALKAINKDGSKGGGGEMSSDGIINIADPRKNFYDVAFWRGGVITNNDGTIELEATLPDNLTTRVIETVGLSKEGLMASQRHEFVVTKPVIINANMPQFVTRGDMINIPINVIINDTSINTVNLTGSMTIGTIKKPLSITKTSSKKFEARITLDEIDAATLTNNDTVTITIGASPYDTVVRDIPLRKDNFLVIHRQNNRSKQHNFTHNWPFVPQSNMTKVSISLFPLEIFNNTFSYLLYYPYGCSEQLTSSLFPLLVGKKLADQGIPLPQFFSGNQVRIKKFGSELTNTEGINTIITQTLPKILSNIKQDGLIGYRPGSNEENGSFLLSVYVYTFLREAEKQGININIQQKQQLANAINRKSKNQSEELYWMMSLALGGERINTQRLNQFNIVQPQDQIMNFIIRTFIGQNTKSQHTQIMNIISNNTDNIYLTEQIMKAYVLRALIRNKDITTAKQLVEQFITSANNNGLRGRSTQQNIQILIALGEFIKAIQGQQTSFEIIINNESIKGQLTPTTPEKNYTFMITGNNTNIMISGSNDIIMAITHSALPTKKSDTPVTLNNISRMSMTFNDKSPITASINELSIGQQGTIKATFTTDQAAEHLAVAIPIPSNVFIPNPTLNPQSKQEGYYNGYGYQIKQQNHIFSFFDEGGNIRNNCIPTHYEVRFDQFFVYYGKTQAGTTCNIQFPIIKTHNGIINIPPYKIFEMYNSNVYGTQLID